MTAKRDKGPGGVGRIAATAACCAALLSGAAVAEDLGVLAPPVDLETLAAGDVFREGDVRPRMVVVDGGAFEFEEAYGRREMTAPRFAIAETEITVGAFRLFVEATGREAGARQAADRAGDDVVWSAPGFEQTDDHPVVCVSWGDAAA